MILPRSSANPELRRPVSCHPTERIARYRTNALAVGSNFTHFSSTTNVVYSKNNTGEKILFVMIVMI